MEFDANELSKWPIDAIRNCFPHWFHRVMGESLWTSGCQRVLEEYLDFQPDVIHGHTFHGLALGLYLKLIFRKPMVYSIPALFCQLEDAGVGWLPEVYGRFHPWVDRFFTAYPAELLGIGVPAEKVVTLPGTVDLEMVMRAKSGRERSRLEIRRALGIAEDTMIALSVGRLHPSKGHQYALDALQSLTGELPNLHWVVLGINWQEERAKLENQAAALGVSKQMHLVGFVSDPLPFYAAADIYLRTTVFEGDNLSSYQAMAMGLPVIGFDTRKETELISKVKHGILVPLRDAAAVAAAVEQVLSLPDHGRSMGASGEDYSRTHMDAQELVSLLRSVYFDLHRSENK
jgi:glycosyltransferase involved in cell wall biosynthesis